MTVESVANYLGKSYTEVDRYKDVVPIEAIAEDLALSDSEALKIANLGTPVTAPGAPTGVVATVVDATHVSVAFVPPASDGGAGIDFYTVTSSPGGFAKQGSGSPIVIQAAFATATPYTFGVTATNEVGVGAGGTSAAVTPKP